MSEGHYTLEVYPDMLRNVARQVGELREQLRKSGQGAGNQPGAIGDAWKGSAATDVKGAMTDLGTLIGTFDGRLQPVAEGARTLATTYQEALDQLPSLNRRWNAANDAYDEAVRSADRALDKGTSSGTPDKPLSQFERNELKEAHGTAVGTAASDRATAHNNLDYEYGQMKQWLAGETRKLETVLAEAGPVTVTDDQIAQWNAGEGPTISPAALYGDLPLMQQRADRLAEIELEQQREEAREDAQNDIDDLNQAIEDDDAEAVQAALEAIGEHKDDDIYSAELIDLLGAEGIQDVYLAVDDLLTDSDTDMETIWPSLESFNDTVALGISQLSDPAMAAGLRTFMDKDYGPKIWALIASSDNADGRINAIALSYQSEIYNASLSSNGGMPGLFPQVFNYAYGDNDMLDQLDDRSSGADLADILEHATDDQVDDIMNRLHNVQTEGGTMNEDDYQHLADLYGEMLVELKDRHLAALEESDGARPDLLMKVLEFRYRNASYPQYTDPFAPYLSELVNDPEWALWYLNNSRDGFVPASTFKDLIAESGSDPEEIITRMTTYQIQRGDSPEQVATNLGLMLRENDLLGDDIKWDGVIKSLIDSGVSAALGSNPFTGPVKGVFDALFSEMQRLEEADQSLDDAMGKNAAQEIFAFTIYTQVHGDVPPGFADYVEREHLEDNDRAINLYMQHLEETGGPEWEELQNLTTLIDESRDEQ